MSTFFLIRHGENDWLGAGCLAGRTPGIHLNDLGQRQADAVADYLTRVAITQLFSSPLERARETAAPFNACSGLPLQISEALNEVDAGEWTGQSFKALESSPEWRLWNTHRSLAWVPGGERMQDVQLRVVNEMERLRRAFPQGRIVIFSHADPIRAALLNYLAIPIDYILRLEISPGSISELEVEDWGATVRCLNLRPLKRL